MLLGGFVSVIFGAVFLGGYAFLGYCVSCGVGIIHIFVGWAVFLVGFGALLGGVVLVGFGMVFLVGGFWSGVMVWSVLVNLAFGFGF